MSGTKLLVMRVLRKEETHHGPKIVNLSTVLCLIISHLKKQTLYLPLKWGWSGLGGTTGIVCSHYVFFFFDSLPVKTDEFAKKCYFSVDT